MAAKLLHYLADDNPDLQKQLGCVTGIFQLFDRHHILNARRINQKRLPPPGNFHFSDGSLERDSDCLNYQQTTANTSFNKDVNVNQRISTESARVLFSSSCSSSVSTLDCKSQADAPFDRIVFPETPLSDPVMDQTTIPPHLERHFLDLRDAVKDSMYQDNQGLSLKMTAKEEAAIHALKHKDFPRRHQLSKSVNGTYGVAVDGKQNVQIDDIKESIRVLAKLREAPSYYGETREFPRSSHEVKDGHWHSISEEPPWYSYDGREISRLSFESRDTIKCTPKLKELPRLSLDGREGSWRTYSSDSKSSHLSRNIYGGSSTSDDKVSSLQKPSATQRRLPGVVAKLMGLEALPDSYLTGDIQSNLTETGSVQDNYKFPRSSKYGLARPLLVSNSPKSSLKDPTSPRWKNPDLVMKPISSSRIPVEPAPWKHPDGNRSSQKPSFRAIKAPARTSDSFPSVYSEIEKRLKDLEFKQSGRDLRALKQIMESMQEKGLLESRKEEQAPTVVRSQREDEPKATSQIQNSRSVRQQSPQVNSFVYSTVRGSESARPFESPIVIMKPAKLVEKTGVSSSVIPLGGPSGSQNLQSGGVVIDKGTASGRIAKDHSPRNSRRETSASSNDKKASPSKTTRSAQSQPRSQQFPKENSPSLVKHSGFVSPRLLQKKLELEKRSRPPTPPSNSDKPRRQASKHATESGSPGGKLRPKVPNTQCSDEQLSEISNGSRSLSCQGDEISLQSDGTTVNSKMDMEVTNILQASEIDDRQNPSMKAVKQLVSRPIQKTSTPRLDEDEMVEELSTDGPEYPSPVSVLDGSVYRDYVPSHVKQISDAPKDDGAQKSRANDNEDQWNPADSLSFKGTGSREINRKKLQSIDQLVQKLRRLNSSHDEARIDYIASLCENSNPDHRYISEILLASGLLLRDLSSELLSFQLHSSGHPVNPELFLVLEQTKASSLLSKEGTIPGNVASLKLNTEKFHRKLIFDAVNEILGAKLGSTTAEPWCKPTKLTKKTLGAQKLLKELCFEIEKIQTKKNLECSLEEKEDGLKSILLEDVMHGSESWTDFHGEIPGAVLDVERLIFKDLVDEVVMGEAAGMRVKSSGRHRKLFGK